MGHRTMIMMSSVFLLLSLLPGYVNVESAKIPEAQETSCAFFFDKGEATMVFSTSAPSFDGVNVVNIVCKDDIHGIQHLLELSKSGNSTLAITVIEKDVEFLGIVGNRLLLVDHNLTRASKAGVCYMEHNLAFSGSRHHTCQLKESDPVSDPPVTFPATVSSDDPVSDPPVTSTATVSSDGPLQVYVAVVNTGVLVILVAFGIFIYKWRGDNKQVLEQQLKSFRDQIQVMQRNNEVLEQRLKSFKDHMEEVQRNSEMRTQGRESGPMADAPPIVSLKRRPQRTSPKSFTGRNTNKPDQEDIINIKEDRKRMEADNPCSDVTSAPAVSSPTPVLSMGEGCTPPEATCSIDMQQEPPRGACAARNVTAGNRQHTAPHGDRPVNTTLSMGDGCTPPQATSSTDIQEKPLRGACAARNVAAGNRQHTAPHGDRPVDTILSMGDGCTPPQATSSTDMLQKPPRGACAARNVTAGKHQHTIPHGDRPVDTILFMRDGCTPPQATSSTDIPREPPRGAARNGSARDFQHTTPHGDNRTDNTASDQPVYRSKK